MGQGLTLTWLQPKLRHKGFILVIIPLIFEVFFICVLGGLLFKVEQEALSMERSRNLILETESLQRQFVEMGTAVAGYSLSKNPMFGSQFSESKSKILDKIGMLRDLVKDDPDATVVVDEIEKVVHGEIKHLEEMLDEIERDASQKNQFENIQESFVQLTKLFENVVKRQRNLVRGGPDTENFLRTLVEGWLLVGVFANVLIAVGLVVYFNSSTSRRLNVLMDNSSRLSRQEELLPSPGGHDEFAELDNIFRTMAVTLADAIRKERAIVDNAVDVICSIDRNLQFLAVNPACEAQWGYQASELSGRKLEDLVMENVLEVCRIFKEVIETKTNQSVEIKIRSRQNKSVDTLWTLQWSDAENQLFCVSHDITERKLADQIRKDVVAMVSHDLRTPLSSILASVESLTGGSRGEISEKVERELNKMGTSASRMVRLINDFLDLEKLQSGRVELTIERRIFGDLVTSSVQAIKDLAELKKINFKEVGTDVDLKVDGDRIVQVMVNLLGNATKFSPEGGLITIAATRDRGEVEISVTDQGPGIEQEQQAAIFENFTQLDIGFLPGSSGLGLSICRNLVELHGGTIGVRSKPGAGSTFWFRIPQNIDGAGPPPT